MSGAGDGQRWPSPSARFRRNPRLADQVLGEKAVVLHYEGHRMLGLNESGTVLWSLLDGSRCFEEIVTEFARRQQAPEDEARDAAARFLAELGERDLVEVVDATSPAEGAHQPRTTGPGMRPED